MNENNVPAGTLPDPCPFCGGACAVTKGHSLAELPWSHDGGDFHRVYCSQCQSRQLFHRNEADAVAAWNLRAAAPVAQPPAIAEAVAPNFKRPNACVDRSHPCNCKYRCAREAPYEDTPPEGWHEDAFGVLRPIATQPPAPVQHPGPSGDVPSDFQEGQWWLQKLDEVAAAGTDDFKRAVAVVRNLMRTAHAQVATPPAHPVLAPVVREPMAAEMYYLQCSRDYVGNCPLWWREGGNGYTTRLDEAGRFTLGKAAQQMRSRDGLDVPWLCSEIDALRRPTVDVQDMHKALRDLDVQRAAVEHAHGIQATTGEAS